MDFLNFIIHNGCSIICYYDDEKNYNRIGLQLFTPADVNLELQSLDNDISLLLTLLIAHIAKYVNDPFTYDQERGSGKMVINNKEYEIFLPADIQQIFKNNDGLDNLATFNKINNYISDYINTEEQRHIYNQLMNLENVNHFIQNINSDGEKKTIGVGMVFSKAN
jgi:hypothetical protein